LQTHPTEQQDTTTMSPVNQTTSDITTTVTPHSTSATTTTSSLNAAHPIEPPEESTVTFTHQDAPLLRLPGELRNRIYHELFQPFLDKLEADNEANKNYDPKVLRPALAGLTACRQIHHEAMTVLFRTYIAEKPSWWCLRGKNNILSFFTRTALFCQTLKRYAPELRLAVRHQSFGRSYERITPACAKLFLEELACQVQQDVCVTFTELPNLSGGNTFSTSRSDTAAWDAHWKVKHYFGARGSVGGYRFAYLWFSTCADHHCSLSVEGCLAQLNRHPLEKTTRRTPSGYLRY
jgi:hypothetical protein